MLSYFPHLIFISTFLLFIGTSIQSSTNEYESFKNYNLNSDSSKNKKDINLIQKDTDTDYGKHNIFLQPK